MKCAYIKGVRKIKKGTIDEPKSRNGYVVIDVKKCGICGSDIHYWDIGGPKGLVMGHEFCGIVIDPGDNRKLKVGDRVTALPISPCGKCEACESKNPQYCPDTWTHAVGLSLDNPGGYAEKLAVRPDMVIKVPKKISDNEVAMVEPTAVSYHAAKLANIKKGDSVLIIGAGIIGDLCATFAKLMGAKYVAISEVNEKRAKKAKKLGCCDEFFNPLKENFMPKVMSNCRYGYDVVIDCCGNSAAVSTAITCVKPHGNVVLVGVSLANIEIPSSLVVTKELNVYGAIAYTKKEFQDCIGFLLNEKINVLKFVDEIVSLDDVQNAFERLTNGNDDAIKILIQPNM